MEKKEGEGNTMFNPEKTVKKALGDSLPRLIELVGSMHEYMELQLLEQKEIRRKLDLLIPETGPKGGREQS